jgi:hypothetical protein
MPALTLEKIKRLAMIAMVSDDEFMSLWRDSF